MGFNQVFYKTIAQYNFIAVPFCCEIIIKINFITRLGIDFIFRRHKSPGICKYKGIAGIRVRPSYRSELRHLLAVSCFLFGVPGLHVFHIHGQNHKTSFSGILIFQHAEGFVLFFMEGMTADAEVTDGQFFTLFTGKM